MRRGGAGWRESKRDFSQVKSKIWSKWKTVEVYHTDNWPVEKLGDLHRKVRNSKHSSFKNTRAGVLLLIPDWPLYTHTRRADLPRSAELLNTAELLNMWIKDKSYLCVCFMIGDAWGNHRTSSLAWWLWGTSSLQSLCLSSHSNAPLPPIRSLQLWSAMLMLVSLSAVLHGTKH